MDKKYQVHNLIILDESSSMYSIKETIIQGFNEVVQSIKGIEKGFPEQEHFVSFHSFNGNGHTTHHYIEPARNLKELNAESYQPNSTTPLFDAMGYSLIKLKEHLQGQTDYNVLVTILTDGEENASTKFSGNRIKKLVEELKLNNWTFTYMGTEHDVERIANSLSIENTLYFQKNEEDIKVMFAKEREARESYSQKIQMKEDTTSNYFKREK